MKSLLSQIKPTAGLVAIILVALFGLVIIFRFATGEGLSELTSLATSRTILMFLIVGATVFYGGVLINKPLTSEDDPDKLEKKFRMGREIFLVFSGICGTVVGFYFGSDDRTASTATVAVNTSLAADGTITAFVAGGAPPFKVALVKGTKSLPMTMDSADPAKFTLAKNDKECPSGYLVEVTGQDSTKYPAVKLGITEAEFKGNRNWNCADKPSPEPSSSQSPTPKQ